MPDPVSPVISTEADEGATCSTRRMTSCIGLACADQFADAARPRAVAASAPPLAAGRAPCPARGRAAPAGRRPFSGFSMYQKAPASMAATARSSLPLPVMMIAGTVASSSPRRPSSVKPSMPGSSTSAIRTAGRYSEKRARASSALATPKTSRPHLGAKPRNRAAHSLRPRRSARDRLIYWNPLA